MCVITFLEHYDLAGKRIVPFCTNKGFGMGGSERHLKKVCTGATIERGGNRATRGAGAALQHELHTMGGK